MHRIGNLYEEISSIENCIEACSGAIKYKKKRNIIGTLPFDISVNPEYYGYQISEMLKNRTFVPSDPNYFVIHEGINQKRREIYAPKLFPDQLVHWAIMQIISPILTKGFYYYSCGSIPGRGPERARRYLTHELSFDKKHHKKVKSTYRYCLKLDIHHFFQSIDRDIVMDIFRSKFKDEDVIDLVESIVRMPNTGTGLPIGFYTSQWLANMYLDGFDHWLVDTLAAEFEKFIYVRYVDDLVICASNKRKLIRIKERIIEYLAKKLKLRLKYETNDQIFEVAKRPIDFVGFRFTFGKTTVRNKVYRRAIEADKRLNAGKYTIHSLTSVISYDGFMNKADCYQAKKELYKYDTGFYKVKLKQLQTKCDNQKVIAKQQAMTNLKTYIKKTNEAEFENGNISKVTCYRDDDGEYMMKKELIARVT